VVLYPLSAGERVVPFQDGERGFGLLESLSPLLASLESTLSSAGERVRFKLPIA